MSKKVVTIRGLPAARGGRWMTWAVIPEEEVAETIPWLRATEIFKEIEVGEPEEPRKRQKRDDRRRDAWQREVWEEEG